MTDPALQFSVFSGSCVAAAQWQRAAELFSRAYGFYSRSAPDGKAGRPIRLGASYYRRAYANDAYKVAFCHDGDRLVGQIVYCECQTSRGRVAFVVQLVVDAEYRRKGIASTMLHAVWGFSDYYAWGIVTSNAFTIEALESATFRRTNSRLLSLHAEWLKSEVLDKIDFLRGADWRVSESESRIDTRFFTDRSQRTPATEELSRRLGPLSEGEEWLAVTFREQSPDDFTAYSDLVAASADFVADAYARMPQRDQPWASRTDNEITAILSWLPELPKDACICDFGAGSGRHVEALRRRGYVNVEGVDFASSSEFVKSGDCRLWRGERPFDLVLCLYDVIGSFAEDVDNRAILDNIVANLRPGGHAVISVSNFRYQRLNDAERIDWTDQEAALRRIFALSTSETMQRNGEYFDPNCLLVDESRRLVFHKEQFSATGVALPGEYLIRDRRFTSDEIVAWARASGLHVLERHFVRAGFSEEHSETTAKEILLVTRL